DEFRAILELALDFGAQLGHRFLARRPPGADGERLGPARAVAVAFHPFDEDWNLHKASALRWCLALLLHGFPRHHCTSVPGTYNGTGSGWARRSRSARNVECPLLPP